MAVRDEEQPPAERPQASTGLPWREALSYTPALLLLSGVLIYGFLSLSYQRFYGSLGVDPNDVGLSYTGTLARSSGFVITVLLAVLFLTGGPLAIQAIYRQRVMPRLAVPLAFGIAWFLLAMYLFEIADQASAYVHDIQEGRPVGAVQVGLPYPYLAVRADPATVEPAGKPGDSPAVEQLQGRELLYLGQSGGIVVLYDAAADRAVYVPASALILKVANCDAKPPPDPACVAART